MAVQEIGGWGFVVGLLLGPGIVAAIIWSPFLLASRIRALFRALPPARSTAVSYVVVTVGLSIPYLFGTIAALVVTEGQTGGAMANALLNVLIPVSSLYVLGLPILAIRGLPRIGRDWDPNGYDTTTWVLLIVGAAWYSALFAVPLFLIAVVLALPM